MTTRNRVCYICFIEQTHRNTEMNNTTSFTKMHNEMIKLRERAEKAEAELAKLQKPNPAITGAKRPS